MQQFVKGFIEGEVMVLLALACLLAVAILAHLKNIGERD
jgi:hypothetical protein